MAIKIAALAADRVRPQAEVELTDGSTRVMRGFFSLRPDDQEVIVDALEQIEAISSKFEKARTRPRPTDRKSKASARTDFSDARDFIALGRANEKVIRIVAATPEDAQAILTDPGTADPEILAEVIGYWAEETGAGEA